MTTTLDADRSNGSSPRVRGKRPDGATTSRPPRLIPACAGKTSPCARLSSIVTAHPRACGENLDLADPESFPLGSSPRVRGKLGHSSDRIRDDRLIPARAGKTGAPRPDRQHHQAHPRACGENPAATSNTSPSLGSSPRVRGKLRRRHDRLAQGRLIPARAGKTRGCGGRRGRRPAHPRACGENFEWSVLQEIIAGSSPRVRGKPLPSADGPVAVGLIPARAGKTRVLLIRRKAWTAHPRACGENCSGTST